MATATPSSDELCGSWSYHVTTAYWSRITKSKVAKPWNSSAHRRHHSSGQLPSQLLIKGVCSAAYPPSCSRTTPRGQFQLKTRWHRRPRRQMTKVLLVMVRLSLI